MFRKILRRLFCLHLNWTRGFHPLPWLGVGETWRAEYWHCTKCGKNKLFSRFGPGPMRYIE